MTFLFELGAMSKAFLTSLQDLVFGLFGSLAMLVVIFSIFSQGEHSFQDRFLLVRVEWRVEAIADKPDDVLEAALTQVTLTRGRKALPWEFVPELESLRRAMNDGLAPASVYFVSETLLNQEPPGTQFALTLPEFAKRAVLRTRGGESEAPGGARSAVDLD